MYIYILLSYIHIWERRTFISRKKAKNKMGFSQIDEIIYEETISNGESYRQMLR